MRLHLSICVAHLLEFAVFVQHQYHRWLPAVRVVAVAQLAVVSHSPRVDTTSVGEREGMVVARADRTNLNVAQGAHLARNSTLWLTTTRRRARGSVR